MEQNPKLMETIISLCKRRGFIYQGSEIYGGLAGTYTYGPLGSLLKNNIRDSWLNFFVHSKNNMYLIDAPILMHPRVWEASGHVDQFSDPTVKCLNCGEKSRVDQIIDETQFRNDLIKLQKEMDQSDLIRREGQMSLLNEMEKFAGKAMADYLNIVKKISCSKCGKVNWAIPNHFNLMLETKMGAVEETSIKTFLRPEEAQSMFVHFKDILDSFSPKLPFGIAQVGKAFRNEITPRDFTYRLREFEIVEFEYFIHPDTAWESLFDQFLEEQKIWLDIIGISRGKLHEMEHPETGRAHYSKKTVDLEFEYPFGIKELTGLAHRGSYDLGRHQEFSGVSMEILDEETKQKFLPEVLEPTVSLDRTVLAVLCSAYREDEQNGEVRSFLALKPSVAPIICAVSPLLKNKPELVEKSQEVFKMLKKRFGRVMFDDNGNIGKRYRRQDEIGTPWCVVVDFDTLGENPELLDTVTIRDRDTGVQTRLPITELESYISEKLA